MSTVLTARRPEPNRHTGRGAFTDGSPVHFSTRWCGPTTVVSAHGELDASNATKFVDHLLDVDVRRLVLDLSDANFVGTAVLSVLHMVSGRCPTENGTWALIPGLATRRLLRVCDPESTMPICASLDEALRMLDAGSRLLQLVAKSR